jgi:hypothetical protein
LVKTQITLASACALIAFSAVAFAQVRPADVTCKSTETQPECHARLKCKPNEEIEDCQKRLLRCNANETMADCVKRASSGGSSQGNNGGGRDNGDQRGGDRGGDREGDRNDRDRGDDRREDRGDDRRDRGGEDRRDRDDGGRSRGRRSRRHGGNGGHGFEANKVFGLGLELGEPTGLNGKYFVSPSGALDFGVGWIYDHYYYGDGLHLYADYLFHFSLASAEAFELPFYVGPGLRFWDFHYCYQGVCDPNYGGTAIGIRVPFGISFDFNNAPLDIFLQLVPVLDFVNGDYYSRYYHDRAHFGIDGTIGIRFWFK